MLLVTDTATKPADLGGRRVGFEAVPSMPDAQAELRERYSGFVYEDRKGNSWVYRGPHSPGGNPVMTLQFYYKTLPGFFFPSLTLSQQPPVGTVTPYLRSIDPALADPFVGDAIFGNADNNNQRADGNALGIRYRAAWPTHAPTLQMAETLLTPKRGLPAVRGQTSMEVLYEQSQATREDHAGTTVLHDPTRPKKYPLVDKDKGSTTALASIPSAIETSSYRGKVYFPNLPPHLADRFYFDPNEGKNGSLVLVGRFVDAAFGEDYLQPNVLSTNDFKALVDLCEACWTPPTRIDGPGWSNAIRQLSTKMEQFVPSKSQPGTFVVDPSRSFVTNRTAVELAEVVHSDVAVDSYALTAVGPGIGYVSLIAGQGSAFTPEDDPVSVLVIRVDPELYRGEVVPIESSNPLAEKLTLQQTIDLAGRTADYLFEWKIAAPVDGLPPRVYTTTTADLIPASGSTWKNLSYPRASDTPASIEGTAAERLGTPVATQVVVVDSLAYRTVSKQGLRLEFATAPTPPHRLTEGVPVTVRLQDGTGIPGTISSLTTANNVVVDPAANAANNVAVTDIVGLDERPVSGLPQGYLYKTFTRNPAVPLSDLWLSLDLDAGLGAEVFVDGQSVVRAQTAADASAPGTAPDTLDTLALAYRIPTSALAGGRTTPDGRREHLVVVALHAPAVPGASLRFDLRLQALTATDITDRGWLPMDPERYADGIRAILGGKADVQALSDNYIIMRYRAAKAGHASYVADPDAGWSPWTQPALAEGWIKRVLRGINPFNQRVTDLFNNQISTDVSIVAQAGPRWEGNVALNQDNLNDAGLIEIYETVLNRGKDLSIHAGINYGPANDALLLAAGYLADLYMMLGNEAWADASNPTIGIGTADRTYGDIATALFSFKGQLPTLLEEELALLRGRDDSLLPGVETAPVYNRLVWNYTRGIDSGETIYSLNYNILDQNGDGRVDASDAQKLYPQGHGDAYGHFLTALTGYYQLLLDPDFDWVPRIEAVNVLGKPVSVDYQDERKFAAAAAAVARTGKSIVDLTWRQQYASDPAKGWSQFAETKTHDRTTANALRATRYWGLDHWAVRTGQGAFLNWVVGNAILPDKDTDLDHAGSIQQVDRDTVPELRELPALGAGVQTTVDNAEGFLTPLGLPPNSIPFDLNPLSIANGNKTTHFEQIYERAKEALGNALVAFDDAKDVTRLMRSEEDSLADLRSDTKQQELTYKTALVELYGTPYTDDIGPGKTYPAGYDGPDLVHSMYVDNVELAFGTMLVPSSNTTWRVDIQTFTDSWLSSGRVVTKDGKAEAAAADDRISDFGFIKLAKAFAVDGTSPTPEYLENRSLFVEYNLAAHGFSKPTSWQGRRASPGRIQQSISDIIKARNAAFEAFYVADAAKDNLDWAIRSLDRRIASHSKVRGIETLMRNIDTTLKTAKTAAGIVDKILETMSHEVGESLKTISEAAPLSFIAGVAAGGDLTSSARALLKANGLSTEIVVDWKKVASFSVISGLELLNDELMKSYQVDINDENWKQELRDATSEVRDLVYGMQNQFTAINAALQELDDAQRAYRAALAEGDRIQAEREVFRQRSAAIVQGYRTRDAAFRVFRSEKLERYKMLFDLAAQYTYMAAQAFDYETGLLHTQRGREFIDRIVRSRALGVMPDGEPQFAGSNTGDPGLSSVMAEMASDWSVLKTRLGFKNPDAYGTTVSLREENFRILPGEDHDSAWIDRLEAGRT
ncbi:MAG: hypothetical protein JNL97_01410, partial [Verrucomicrobiales bacterium]|nr:hypothetical protein [Verrucomicrobiales bacterium]